IMERERLTPLLPDGVDKSESDELDATWQMLGSIDAPAPDSDRMRARLDAVIDAIDAPSSRHSSYVLQGLAAAAILVIGIAIGWFGGPGFGGPGFGASGFGGPGFGASDKARPTAAEGTAVG